MKILFSVDWDVMTLRSNSINQKAHKALKVRLLQNDAL